METGFSEVPQQQKVALGILLLVGLFMFYTKVYTPLKANIKETQVELEKKRAKLVDMQRQARKLNKLEEELKQLEANLKITEKKLPPTKELPQFIRMITDTVAKFGMELNTLKEPAKGQSAVAGGQYFSAHPYEMQLVTDYHTFGMFFSEIVQLERIFGISDLSFIPVSSGSEQLTAKFMIVIYTFNK